MHTVIPRPASVGSLFIEQPAAAPEPQDIGHRTLKEAAEAQQEIIRLAARPAFGPPQRPHTSEQAKTLAEETGDLAPELREAVVGVAQDLRWQATLIANGGGTDVAAPIHLSSDARMSPALNRLTVGDGAVATGAVTRATANGTLVVPGSDGEQALALNRDPYTTGIGYQARLPVGGATVNAGADIYAGRNIKGVAVGTSAALFGAQVGLGLALTVVTHNNVAPTGKVRYSDAGELEMLATYTTEVMPILALGMQGAEAHVGGGFRLVGMHGRGAEFEKFVPVTTLGRELREQNVWWRDIRETGRSLGFLGEPPPPRAGKLAAAEAVACILQVGEKITWKRTKGLIFGISAGAMGARANCTGKVNGESTMSLTRPNENAMELTITSNKVRGLSFSADFPMVAETYTQLATALGRRRVYRFDMREPAAQEALRRALLGDMPSTVLPPTKVDDQMADRFMGLMARERLPAGVENISIEGAEEHLVGHGIGGLRPLALSKHLDGIGHQRSRSRHQRVVAARGEAVVERGITSSKQTELLRAAREHTASAAVQTLQTLDDDGRRSQVFVGVRTQLTFDQKRSGQGARQQLVRALNSKLGHTVDAQKKISSGNSYKLSLHRLIRPRDLERLAAASPAAIDAATVASRLPPAAARAFCASLAGLSPEEMGEKVVAFIAKHRSRGMGALQELLGDDAEPLEVEIDSSAYDRPLAKLLEQLVRLTGLEEKVPLQRELKRIIRLEESLENSLKDLAADSIFRALDEEGFVAALTVLGDVGISLRESRRTVLASLAKLAAQR